MYAEFVLKRHSCRGFWSFFPGMRKALFVLPSPSPSKTQSFKSFFFFFLKILFIHERQRQRHRQGPCRKPHGVLDPGTLGSRPEPKADTEPLSHPGAPSLPNLVSKLTGLCTSQDPPTSLANSLPFHKERKSTRCFFSC